MSELFSYGDLPYSAKTTIQYDKIYHTKEEMLNAIANNNDDGVYVGRYVLISSNEDPQVSVENKKYDGTLWQKIYSPEGNTVEYVYICNLNGTPPTVELETQNPSINTDPTIKLEYIDNSQIKITATKPWRVNSNSISVIANNNAKKDSLTLKGTDGELSGTLELKGVYDAIKATNTAAQTALDSAAAADAAKDAFEAADTHLNTAENIIGNLGQVDATGPVFAVVDNGTTSLQAGYFDKSSLKATITSLENATAKADAEIVSADNSILVPNYDAITVEPTSNGAKKGVTLKHNDLANKFTANDVSKVVMKDNYYTPLVDEEAIVEDFIDYIMYVPIIDSCGHVVGKQKQIVKIPDVQAVLKKFIGDTALYQTNKENGRIISTLDDALYWKEHLSEYSSFCQQALENIIFKVSSGSVIIYSANSKDFIDKNALVLGLEDDIIYRSKLFGGKTSETNPKIQPVNFNKVYPVDNITNGTYYNDVVNLVNQVLSKWREVSVYEIPSDEKYILIKPFKDYIGTQTFQLYDATKTRAECEKIISNNLKLLNNISAIFARRDLYFLFEAKDSSESETTHFTFRSFGVTSTFKKGTFNDDGGFGLKDNYSVNYIGFGAVSNNNIISGGITSGTIYNEGE